MKKNRIKTVTATAKPADYNAWMNYIINQIKK